MRKYLQERYDIIDRRTGVKICEAGSVEDALAMIAFDPANRTYTINRMVMGEIIDVEVPKELLTSEVVRSVVQPEPLRLAEDERRPVEVS